MVNNPKFFGQSTTLTPNQIEDGVDFPHTGLLKALSSGVIGNYVISGFNITVGSNTTGTVSDGVIMFEGLRKEITLGGSNSFTLTGSSSGNVYHLLVIKPDNTLALRSPTANAIDKVADIGESNGSDFRDTIIAVLTCVNNGSSAFKIQYLTYDKRDNSLTVMNNSVESGKITGDSNSLDIVSTPTNANINITPNGNGKIVLDGLNWPIADGNAAQVLTTDGANGLFFSTISTNSITDADGDTKIQVEESANEDKIRFDTANNERMIIDENGNVGIGTSTPAFALDVANGGLRTSANIVSLTDISATNGIISGNILTATSGISNSGKRSRSFLFAADANQGGNPGASAHGTTVHARAELTAITSSEIIDCNKEEYYVGYDSAGTNNQSHQGGGLPNNPSTAVGSGTEFEKLTIANVNEAASFGSHTYNVHDVFGGNALFVAIQPPEFLTGREIVIHNITSYGLYVLVANPELDPSAHFLRNRVNGGFTYNNPQFNSLTGHGNERVVNMNNILCGATTHFPLLGSTPNMRDAILLKPRESVRLRALKFTGGDGVSPDLQNDAGKQQGLFHNHNVSGNYGIWYITSSSSGAGFANIGTLDANTHIPVHLTGTSFFCSSGGSINIALPNNPPVGTQYSFICKQGTVNIVTAGSGGPSTNSQLSSSGQSSGADIMVEINTPISPPVLTISAGQLRTCIYTTNGEWQIIG